MSAPSITAPRSATESGRVPEKVKMLTFTSLGFWNTKTKITTKTISRGSNRIHALDDRVDEITSEEALGSTPASTASSPCLALATGSSLSSPAWLRIDTPVLPLERGDLHT